MTPTYQCNQCVAVRTALALDLFPGHSVHHTSGTGNSMSKKDVETERCPDCGALIALVGRRHRCMPRGRGRPSLGAQAMTPAQRQRRSRARKKRLAKSMV
jgi:hypothetical protein